LLQPRQLPQVSEELDSRAPTREHCRTLSSIFFHGWSQAGRALVLAVLAYLTLVILLRVTGKRTLTKLNVFDFVFVVALGSALSTTILSPDVSLVDGIITLGTLIGLQILLSWLCVRSHWLDKVINGLPVLLMHRGKFLRDVMQRERVTEEEIRAAIRNAGVGDIDAADSVVLETDGTFSVVHQHTDSSRSALSDVIGHPAADQR
jgi:uncharacterized membrane protein YcaP (DUF421 family)